MSQTYYSLIKVRRGKNTERSGKIFEQGEPLYTTDTQRFYVGTGSDNNGATILSGSTITGNLVFKISDDNKNPGGSAFSTSDANKRKESGDILYNTTSKRSWLYDGSNWIEMTVPVDNNTVRYENNKLTANTFTFSTPFEKNSNNISLNYNNNNLTVSDNKLDITFGNVLSKQIDGPNIIGTVPGIITAAGVIDDDDYNGSIISENSEAWQTKYTGKAVRLFNASGGNDDIPSDWGATNCVWARSAGFIIFDSGSIRDNYKNSNYKRYAIPVFALPDGPKVTSATKQEITGENFWADLQISYIDQNTNNRIYITDFTIADENTITRSNEMLFPTEVPITLYSLAGVTTITIPEVTE